MDKIPGLEIYNLNFKNEINLDFFNKKENVNKIQTINHEYRKVKIINIEEDYLTLTKEIEKEISRCLRDYQNKYLVDVNSYEGLTLVEYSEGGHFNTHVDNDGYYERLISLALYLNDDYEVGEIEFTLFEESVGKIKPCKNQLILFPSNYLYRHTAHPVKNGKKYMILSFFSKSEKNKSSDYIKNNTKVFKF
jgi:Rps23 Pro-64 3,4-dihydroxylase Tpa1-like proline 4-hydroxylase